MPPVKKLLQKVFLGIEHGVDEAKAVFDIFVPKRQRRQIAGDKPTGDLVAFEMKLRFEFPGQIEHGMIMWQAEDRQRLNSAIVGGTDHPGKQLASDAVMAPIAFDAERRFGCAGLQAQFAGAAHVVAFEISIDDRAVGKARVGVFIEEQIRRITAEAVVQGLMIQAVKMGLIGGQVG